MFNFNCPRDSSISNPPCPFKCPLLLASNGNYYSLSMFWTQSICYNGYLTHLSVTLILKVLQYSIAAPLVSSIGCRWGAAVLPADTPISSKGAFFQPWPHSCLWSQTLTWLIKAFSCVPSYFKNSQKWTVGRKPIKIKERLLCKPY